MKKNYIIISIVAVVVIFIIPLLFILITNDKEIYSTITLDINPSLEINLDKDEKVVSVIPLNDDAKDIIKEDYEDKSLDDVLQSLAHNLVEKNYVTDGEIKMLVNSSIDTDYEKLLIKIVTAFVEKHISVEVIPIYSITKEDEEFAKAHNITPYKAAYINSVKEVNSNIDIETITDKPIKEIKEMKETGNDCDEGYFIDRDHCFKEIERVPAESGKVCPGGYFEYEGKCYEEKPSIETNNTYCRDEFTLKDNKCVRTDSYEADGDCGDNHYIKEEDMCEEEVIVGDAYEFCRDPGRTLYDHKCLATKPTINGGCLNGDMLYNGKCVNTRNDYYLAEWKCSDGEVITNDKGELIYPDKKCRENKKVKVTSYKCNEGFTLNGKTCFREEIEDPQKERVCPNGFTKVLNDRCINLSNTKEFENGHVCKQENSKVIGTECVIYEIIEAKK